MVGCSVCLAEDIPEWYFILPLQASQPASKKQNWDIKQVALAPRSKNSLLHHQMVKSKHSPLAPFPSSYFIYTYTHSSHSQQNPFPSLSSLPSDAYQLPSLTWQCFPLQVFPKCLSILFLFGMSLDTVILEVDVWERNDIPQNIFFWPCFWLVLSGSTDCTWTFTLFNVFNHYIPLVLKLHFLQCCTLFPMCYLSSSCLLKTENNLKEI